MSQWIDMTKRFLLAEDGPTSVEYAIMLLLILVACITGVSTFGTDLAGIFHRDSQSVASAVTGASAGS